MQNNALTMALEHYYQTLHFFCQLGSKKLTFVNLAKTLLYQTSYFNFIILFFNISLLFYFIFSQLPKYYTKKNTITLKKYLLYSLNWWTVAPSYEGATVHQLPIFNRLGRLMVRVFAASSLFFAVFTQMLTLIRMLLLIMFAWLSVSD